LQGLSGLFVGQLLGRELPQLFVYHWQELTGGSRVTLLDGAQDTGNIVHARPG
jgi:hypothetical protein